MTFLAGVVTPIIFVFVHASLRMRNMKNKVTETLMLWSVSHYVCYLQALATKNAFWKRLSIDSQEVIFWFDIRSNASNVVNLVKLLQTPQPRYL